MVRLSDIPENVLKEIEKFVREKKGEVPVTTSPREDGSMIKTLPDLVEEKFGYRLSPSQIYDLQRGAKTYRVKVDIETVRELEEHFGSVGKGIKQMLKFYSAQRLPPHLRKPHEVLLKKEKISPSEIEELLLPFVKESREVWKIVGELSKLGYITRDKEGNFVISRFRRDPVAELFFVG